jgi:hypothetical protein
MTNETERLLSQVSGVPRQMQGQLALKGGSFVLKQDYGNSVWLEVDPVPRNLIGARVVVVGIQSPPNVVWVQTIRPINQD